MMAPDVIYELLSAAFGTAFGAGGAWFMIKQSRRDVNGLGRKMNSEIKRSQARWQNLSLALMLICTAEQRTRIAELLKEAPEGDS